MSVTPQFLNLADRRLAYQQHRYPVASNVEKCGVVFLGGFGSDFMGTKACFLAETCAQAQIDFLRFDYRGHGLSDGAFVDGCIGDWFADAVAVFEALTVGPQILVGSSMGGWMAFLLALHCPERVAGIVGVAAAPDFTEELIWKRMTAQQQEVLLEKGVFEDHGLPITRHLVEEGRKHLIMGGSIGVNVPVHLIQGMMDEEVPHEYAMRLARLVATGDVRVSMIKEGDHRLSRSEDLDFIGGVVAASVCRAEEAMCQKKG